MCADLAVICNKHSPLPSQMPISDLLSSLVKQFRTRSCDGNLTKNMSALEFRDCFRKFLKDIQSMIQAAPAEVKYISNINSYVRQNLILEYISKLRASHLRWI